MSDIPNIDEKPSELGESVTHIHGVLEVLVNPRIAEFSPLGRRYPHFTPQFNGRQRDNQEATDGTEIKNELDLARVSLWRGRDRSNVESWKYRQ